jgi:hypothetical protein
VDSRATGVVGQSRDSAARRMNRIVGDSKGRMWLRQEEAGHIPA